MGHDGYRRDVGQDAQGGGCFEECVFNIVKQECQKRKAELVWGFLNWKDFKIKTKTLNFLKFPGYFSR